MKPKNSQLHFFLETETLNALKREAYQEGISLAELCRRKLRESCKLIKIEILLENLNHKIQGCSTCSPYPSKKEFYAVKGFSERKHRRNALSQTGMKPFNAGDDEDV